MCNVDGFASLRVAFDGALICVVGRMLDAASDPIVRKEDSFPRARQGGVHRPETRRENVARALIRREASSVRAHSSPSLSQA